MASTSNDRRHDDWCAEGDRVLLDFRVNKERLSEWQATDWARKEWTTILVIVFYTDVRFCVMGASLFETERIDGASGDCPWVPEVPLVGFVHELAACVERAITGIPTSFIAEAYGPVLIATRGTSLRLTAECGSPTVEIPAVEFRAALRQMRRRVVAVLEEHVPNVCRHPNWKEFCGNR